MSDTDIMETAVAEPEVKSEKMAAVCHTCGWGINGQFLVNSELLPSMRAKKCNCPKCGNNNLDKLVRSPKAVSNMKQGELQEELAKKDKEIKELQRQLAKTMPKVQTNNTVETEAKRGPGRPKLERGQHDEVAGI